VSDEAIIPFGNEGHSKLNWVPANGMPLVADESLPGAAIYQNG